MAEKLETVNIINYEENLEELEELKAKWQLENKVSGSFEVPENILDLDITVFTVSLIILLSAFSQDFSPQNSSSKHLSKYLAIGPSDSFGPTIDAVSKITGFFSNLIVCFPNFSINFLPFFLSFISYDVAIYYINFIVYVLIARHYTLKSPLQQIMHFISKVLQ